jgi:septum formation protein
MLILASASARRHELLLAAGIEHLVLPSHVPEDRWPGEPPTDFVQRVAREKAASVHCGASDVVLGADTIVCLNGEIFGKPADDQEAARMLRLLSGKNHWVYTGICLRSAARQIVDVSQTRVSFVNLTEREIEEYTRSGEPRDKAGAYAIQGRASRFVSSIEGCYHNVVGLPVSLVYQHLKTL